MGGIIRLIPSVSAEVIMEEKYKEIGKILRKSIDTDYCYECPFNKMCETVHEEENAYFLCDAIRIMAIEKELKKYEKTLDK